MDRSLFLCFTVALCLIGAVCHAATITDKAGMKLSFGEDGAVSALSVNGKEILDPTQISGFEVEDMNSGKRVHVSGIVTSRNGSVSFIGESRELALQLISTIKPADGMISLQTRIVDLSKSERAVRLYFVLNLRDVGWKWCQDLNNSFAAVPGKCNITPGGFSGHNQSTYPFSAISGKDKLGLAIGWPMSNPRFFTQTFTLGENGSGRFEIYAALGLSRYTDKFPRSADIETIIYSFDGSNDFRSALSKYYTLFPESFKTRVKKQGLWALWLSPGIEDYASRMGVTYHEAEFDLGGYVKNLVRDNERGYLSFQYSEPWGIYHPVPKGFRENHPGSFEAGSGMEIPLDKAKLEEFVRSDFDDNAESDRFPGTTRDKIARTIINTAIERDNKGNWLTHNYFPGGFFYDTERKGWDYLAFIVNPDPEIPRPNRAELEWDGQIMHVQKQAEALGTSIDGVYVDSAMFYMGWDRLNFRREHWKYADNPLIYTKQEDGKYVPVQALTLCYAEHLKYLREKTAARDWPLLVNGWAPLYALIASNIDILGAGECHASTPIVGQEFFAEFRAFAYHKPVSIMDYSLSLSGLPADPKLAQEVVEPRINHYLMYGIYPGTANSFAPGGETEEKLKIVTPVFEKYRDIFLNINTAGWEPIGAARTEAENILLEQWGRNVANGLYYTLHNLDAAEKTVEVKLDLTKIHGVPTSAVELVSGDSVKLSVNTDTCAYVIRVPSKRTVAVCIK